MRTSSLLLVAIAIVIIVGGAALALLSHGAPSNQDSVSPTITSIPGGTVGEAHGMFEVSENSFGIISYKKIIIPKDLLEKLRTGKCAGNCSGNIVVENIVVEGKLKTAYGSTLVIDTGGSIVKVVVPKHWRWNAAEYDLVGLFAEGILSKGMGLKVDAVKVGYKGLKPYIILGYKITLPDGSVLEADIPINS